MFTKNYGFRAYTKLCTELTDAAGLVQSEKLALLLSEAVQAIAKLIAVCQEKENHLLRRAQASYAALRTLSLALALHDFEPLRHTGAFCSDDNPKCWLEDCPRCLTIALSRNGPATSTGFVTPTPPNTILASMDRHCPVSRN